MDMNMHQRTGTTSARVEVDKLLEEGVEHALTLRRDHVRDRRVKQRRARGVRCRECEPRPRDDGGHLAALSNSPPPHFCGSASRTGWEVIWYWGLNPVDAGDSR